MTTLTQPLPRAFGTLGQALRPALLAFATTFAALLLVLGSAAAGYAQFHRDAVFPGVRAGGVDLGGLDRTAAEARLRAALPALGAGHLTLRLGDREHQLEFAAVGRDYALANMLDSAFAVGRAGGPLAQTGEQLRTLTGGVDVAPLATWNQDALEGLLAQLVADSAIAPRDAGVEQFGFGYRALPAADGRAFDVEALRTLVVTELGRTQAGNLEVTLAPEVTAPQIATPAAQAAVDRFARVTSLPLAASGGDSSIIIDQSTLRGWARLQPDPATAGFAVVIDRHAIATYLADMAVRIDRAPAEAGFELTADGVVAVPGATGHSLIVDQSVQRIAALLDARAGGASQNSVELAVASTDPSLTTAEALDLAGRVELLSSWTTRYIPSESNFNGRNISVPAKLLNGSVVGPGERFSFLDEVGDISAARGFGPGGAIIRGRTNPTGAMGGGICSASTTLFNAALRAGFEIESRTQHSYYITRYPVGLDATVWRSGASTRDMVFVNDSEYPLWIRGINGRGKVTFQIWSVPDGRTVKISKPRIENRSPAEDTTVLVSTLAPGETKRVEYPVDGFSSWVTRVVRDASGRTLHEDTYFSRYITVTGITEVGITPDTEPPPEEPPAEEPPPEEPPPAP